MIATLILGLTCVFIILISGYINSKWGLKLSFILIFLFLGLRFEFGNDYETYLDLFNRINENGDLAFDPKMFVFYEPGWLLLNWIFRPIGFFALILFISLIYALVMYKLIKKYILPKYYWLAIFFVVFNPGFLLVHSTAIRQSIAVLIFLLSINYIYEKKIFLFISCILIATTFHYSALTLFIIAPFFFDNRKISFTYGTLLFSLYLFFFLFGTRIAPYFGQVVTLFSERYEFYSDKGTANTGLGFLFYSSLFLLTLNLDKIQNKKIALFFKLAIVYFMLMPFALIIEMTSRVGMYFLPAVLIVYPYIFKTLKPVMSRYIFLLGIMIFTMYQFFQFFYSTTYRDYFMEYHTVFSAPKWN
jgi:transmembrane protein EpsG